MAWATILLLKVTAATVLFFLLNVTSWDCFQGFERNLIFGLWTQLLIMSNYQLIQCWIARFSVWRETFVKSIIQIRKNNGPRIEPCGTPALTLGHEKSYLMLLFVFGYLKNVTIAPNLVKSFPQMKKNTSNLITAIKRFVNIMSYWQR